MIEIIVFIVGMAGVRDQTRRMRLHEESGIPVDRAKDMVKRATGIPRRQFFLETRRQGNRWEWVPKSRVLTDVPQASLINNLSFNLYFKLKSISLSLNYHIVSLNHTI